MRILIAYASAGDGHRRAAQALYDYISQNYQREELRISDILDYTNPIFKNLYSKGYAFLVSRLPCLWNLSYRISYSRLLSCFSKNLRYIINRLNTKGYEKVLIKFAPDVVIATHFLPTEVIASLKKEGKLNTYLVTIITDFSVHPFWISKEVNKYIVASSHTRAELINFGIAENKIVISGIPVDLKFSRVYDRGAISERLGIKQDIFTVILVTAGFGLGPIEKIIELLYQDIQLLVICGRNRRLFERLRIKSYQNVKIFKFVDNIEELMAVSDIIITKPGGLTISESLAMNLPMIFFSAIPGQEVKNARILQWYKVGECLSNIKALRDKVYDYKNNITQLIKIKENISKIRRPYAAAKISDAICQNSIRPAR